MINRCWALSGALAATTVFAIGSARDGQGLAAQESEQLSMGQMVRITGATVLRGGPASPPVLYPVPIEGNIVGMQGDTLLFETGNDPVYWIPLNERPLLERRATVKDTKLVLLVASSVSGLAGATFAWGLNDDCRPRDAAIVLDLATADCGETESGGAAALRGFAIGAGVGVAVGLVLGRFAKRQAWVPVRLEGLRLSISPGVRPAAGLALPIGGRPGGV